MPKYVIQKHEKQDEPVHWDLMLEEGDVLKTFRIDRPPQDLLQHPAQATPIFDHDKRFLTYEGPVNKGLGSVQIQDQGTYQILTQTDQEWQLELAGNILKGKFTLTQEDSNYWIIRKI